MVVEEIKKKKPAWGYALIVNSPIFAELQDLPAGACGEEYLIHDALFPDTAGFAWWSEKDYEKAEETWLDIM